MPAENSISVEQGSLVVTGYLTSFVAAEWDLLLLRGRAMPIERAVSTSELRLKTPWIDVDAADVPEAEWSIGSYGPYWNSNVTTNKKINELLERLRSGLPLKFDAAGPLADRAGFNNQPAGFIFLQTDPRPFQLYVKERADNAESAWSQSQAVEITPAETTLEATAARDVAVEAATTATEALAATVEQAGIATEGAATTVEQAGIATEKAAEAAYYASLLPTYLFDLGEVTDVVGSTLDMGSL